MNADEKKYYFVSMVRKGPKSETLDHFNFVLDIHPAEYILNSRKHLDPVGAIDIINFYKEIDEQEFDLLKGIMHMDITQGEDEEEDPS